MIIVLLLEHVSDRDLRVCVHPWILDDGCVYARGDDHENVLDRVCDPGDDRGCVRVRENARVHVGFHENDHDHELGGGCGYDRVHVRGCGHVDELQPVRDHVHVHVRDPDDGYVPVLVWHLAFLVDDVLDGGDVAFTQHDR